MPRWISPAARRRCLPGASPSLLARIRAKIERVPGSTCLRWTGGTARKRDGAKRPKIQIGGRGSRFVVVARLLLVLRDGVPFVLRDGLEAGHTCHHYWCVNWRHLKWCTRTENEADKREAPVEPLVLPPLSLETGVHHLPISESSK
jgi:hypothetical protein